MPPIEQKWVRFAWNVIDRTIPSGKKIILIELNPETEEIRNQVRDTLAEITIRVKYTDVHGTDFEQMYVKLDSFKRKLTAKEENIDTLIES